MIDRFLVVHMLVVLKQVAEMISVVSVELLDGGVLDFVDRFLEKSRLLRVGDRTFRP